MPRKTKLTPERQEKIVGAIRAGNYANVAAAYAGIDESTFYNWMKRGEDGEEPFLAFFQSVKDAEAEWEVATAARINKAASGSWQAGMTMLERKAPERWGRSDRHDVKHSGEVAVTDSAALKRLKSIVEEANDDS